MELIKELLEALVDDESGPRYEFTVTIHVNKALNQGFFKMSEEDQMLAIGPDAYMDELNGDDIYHDTFFVKNCKELICEDIKVQGDKLVCIPIIHQEESIADLYETEKEMEAEVMLIERKVQAQFDKWLRNFDVKDFTKFLINKD